MTRRTFPNQVLALGSLLGLTVALPAQDPAGEKLANEVKEALARSRPALLKHLDKAQGSKLALVTLAALQDEVPLTDPFLASALSRLERAELQDTYGLALRLMVWYELPRPEKQKKRAAADCKRLLAQQCPTGGFSYFVGTGDVWDLSNTQFAALGLRAAAALGCEIPAERWQRLLKLISGFQAEDGGFGYLRAPTSKPYSSMTVAGIGVLEICKQQLASEPLPEGLDQRIARGWKWLAEHVADLGNLNVQSTIYFHYGLERAGVLSGKDKVGDTDWYRAGAEMLLRCQKHGGGWISHMDTSPGGELNPVAGIGNAIDTSFAVLFLRRKFKQTLTPVVPLTGPAGAIPIGKLGAQADERTIAGTVAFEVARGKSAVPDLLTALRSDVVVRRRAAIGALTKIAGREFAYDPALDPASQAEALKAIEQWWSSEGRRAGAR